MITTKRHRDIIKLIYKRTWVSLLDIACIIPNWKYARRVMRHLENEGYANTVRCQVSNTKGPGLNFYSLTLKGKKQIIDQRHKPTAIPTSTSLLHHYIVNNSISAFESLCNQDAKVITYTAKDLMHKSLFYEYAKERVGSSTKIIIPDFAVVLKAFGEVQAYLGEIDTATETIQSRYSSMDIHTKFKAVEVYQSNDVFKFFDDALSDFDYLHITARDEKSINEILNMATENTHVANLKDVSPQILNTDAPRPTIDYSPMFSKAWFHATKGKIERCSLS